MRKKNKKILLLIVFFLMMLWQYAICIWPSLVENSLLWETFTMRFVYFIISCTSFFSIFPRFHSSFWVDSFIGLLLLIVLYFVELIIPPTIKCIIGQTDFSLQIGVVSDKIKMHGGRYNRGYDYFIHVCTNSNVNSSFEIEKNTYEKLQLGDTLLLVVPYRGGVDIKNGFPTHEEIERYKVPQHYINGELQVKPPYEQYAAAVRDSMLRMSHNQIGYVFEKTDDEYFRHLVKVGIDAEHTTTHEFYETDRNYPKVYKRMNVGDTVILRVSDSMPEINRVLCWQPNEKEIAEYTSYKAIKDYSNCSKEFEDKMLLNSHKSLAFVYDKYQDEHIGAYLEVGIDENHIRTYLFKTFEKDYEQFYKTVSIGDTVIALVSDSIPQLNQVLDWHPTNYYMQIGYIFRKDSRGITKQFNTMVYVGIKKNKLWKHEMSMFKNIHEGDTILMKLSNKDSEYNEVISWHPTPEEIEKYKKTVRLIDN